MTALKDTEVFMVQLSFHAETWRTVENTASNFLGRLAIIPTVLEALGLALASSMI